MKNLLAAFSLAVLLWIPNLAEAQTSRNPCYTTGNQTTQGIDNCIGVGILAPLPVIETPPGGGITGNSTGTTGAVIGTLAAATSKTTYICGFDVSAVGGTAAVGPITVAGLVTSSMVYQLASTATGVTLSRTFTPCIPASATNTAITITTTADGTASAVSVNSWGYQK